MNKSALMPKRHKGQLERFFISLANGLTIENAANGAVGIATTYETFCQANGCSYDCAEHGVRSCVVLSQTGGEQ